MTNRTNKSAKKEFVELRETIETILRRHDPIGLIGMGAPEDEYDPEVGTILPRLKEATTEDQLKGIVHAEFVRWFGAETAGPVDLYTAPARELWAALSSFRAGDSVIS